MKVKSIVAAFAAVLFSGVFFTDGVVQAAEHLPVAAPVQIDFAQAAPLMSPDIQNPLLVHSFLSPVDMVMAVQEEEQRLAEEKAKEEIFEGLAFAKVDKGSFLSIRKKAKKTSKWVGRLYANNAVKVLGEKGSFAKIQSGDVVGYVKSSELLSGEKALKKANRILHKAYPDRDVESLTAEEIRASFTYAKGRKEVIALAKKKGKKLVKNASAYVGNPYVWGGESLTNGADCSGFVKALYAQYGVSLPHSSAGMRRVGVEVSYQDMRIGDIVCYSGHVGIYAGDGKIINAIDEKRGIGYSSVNYAPILTIRRIFS